MVPCKDDYPVFFYLLKNLPYLQHSLIIRRLRVADGWQIWQMFFTFLLFTKRNWHNWNNFRLKSVFLAKNVCKIC